MLLSYVLSGLFLLIGYYTGMRSPFRIHRLSIPLMLKGCLAAAFFFTIMSVAWNSGYLPFSVGSAVMMILYSSLAGYFSGYGHFMVRKRAGLGSQLFVTRSMLTDHVPAFASLLLVLFGLYRTAVLTDLPVTGIRLTSGLSLICAGWLGLTIRIIPDLRDQGILLLDMFIPWKLVISWRWQDENSVMIECLTGGNSSERQNNNRIKIITTTIPPAQKKDFEAVMRRKTDEAGEERREILKELD